VRHLARMTGRHLGRFAGACVLLTGGVGASALATAGTAQAAACGSATPAGTACTLTGTLGVLAGTLNLTSPTALAWSATGSGLDQQVVDPTSAHQSYLVNDATGSGAGWHVTVSATTFTTGTLTLPNSGTFATTGSVSSEAATTAPTAACSVSSTCTLPTDTTTYPVAITTAPTTPTAVTIYDSSAATGLGSITIGLPGAAPVGWWVAVPANAVPSTYTSTVTLEVLSAP
jgi:WxL domain surface cell wall-binding